MSLKISYNLRLKIFLSLEYFKVILLQAKLTYLKRVNDINYLFIVNHKIFIKTLFLFIFESTTFHEI